MPGETASSAWMQTSSIRRSAFLEIVEKFDQGYEVISMVRMKNKTAGLVKNITSRRLL